MIYSKTRKLNFVDKRCDLGFSINSDGLLNISTNLWNAAIEQIGKDKVVCSRKFWHNIFTVVAIKKHWCWQTVLSLWYCNVVVSWNCCTNSPESTTKMQVNKEISKLNFQIIKNYRNYQIITTTYQQLKQMDRKVIKNG